MISEIMGDVIDIHGGKLANLFLLRTKRAYLFLVVYAVQVTASWSSRSLLCASRDSLPAGGLDLVFIHNNSKLA